MLDRTPLRLTSCKVAYNVTQIVICSLVCFHLLPFFLSPEHAYGVWIIPNATVELWVFVYYCCKLLDFGDTFFMVVEKKIRQFTLLHVWHHASIVPLFAYYLSAGMGAGSVSTLPLLNSFVHVLMYSHYLVTTLHLFEGRRWWKPIITMTQIGHHIVLIVFMYLCYYSGNPDASFSVAIWGILWGCSILGLFAKFYVDQYLKKIDKKV